MELKEIYALLESRDAESLKTALTYLAKHDEQKQQAEKRYLNFIKARTGKADATLVHLNEAAFSESEMKNLRSDLPSGYMDTISMYNIQNDDLVMIADLGGALVANHLDVKAYLAQAKVFTELKDLENFINKTEDKLLKILEKEAEIYTEGWFGEMFKKFMGMGLYQLSFDHVSDCGFNDSSLLDEFWIFLSLFLGKGESLKIDVFQATGINVTETTFLMKNMPRVSIQEGGIDFPKEYPLLVERSILCSGPYIFDSLRAPNYALGNIILQNRY